MLNRFNGIVVVGLALGSANAFAALVRAEVAELQFHKVFKLVDAGKVDAGFADHVAGMRITRAADGLNWDVVFTEESDAGATPYALRVSADNDGKSLNYAQGEGTHASRPLDYAGAMPLELMEKAVEYVVDTQGDARLTPYQNGMVSASIAPVVVGGAVQAAVTVSAQDLTATLTLIVDQDGKIISVSQ